MIRNCILCSNTGDDATALVQLVACIEEIRQWMTADMLNLNDNKTEFMLIGSKHSSHNLPQIPSLQVGANGIKEPPTVKNIGSVMDQMLSIHDHLKSVSKSSYTHLRNITCIKKYLNKDSAATLIHPCTCHLHIRQSQCTAGWTA